MGQKPVGTAPGGSSAGDHPSRNPYRGPWLVRPPPAGGFLLVQRAGPLAALALLATLLAVQPAVEGLAPHVEDLSRDLASGDLDPLAPEPGDGGDALQPPASVLESVPGSLTGRGGASFAASPASFPDRWSMDRIGAAGDVTIQMPCDPALGAMKRIKAYDTVEPDYDLAVGDPTLEPVRYPAASSVQRTRTATFTCTFPVQLEAGEAVPIVSPHPEATVADIEATPDVRGLELLQDGADTYHARAPVTVDAELTVTYRADPAYHRGSIPRDLTLDDVPEDRRPDVPLGFGSRVRPVLQEMDLANETNIRTLLRGMQAYFQAFGDGPLPGTDVHPDKYHAIALGGNGCCRHRAFAFAVTAQTLGVPTRVVANEAHAYAESWIPDRGWLQLNLGGCGSYDARNPAGNPSHLPEATDPRTRPPDDEPAEGTPTRTEVTDAPAVVEKGETFEVAGRVTTTDGVALSGVRVHVFLNATKAEPGHLAATAVTGDDGFRVTAEVPDEAPPQAYQLVAGARPTTVAGDRYAASWSDPRVRVTDGTRLQAEAPPTVGVDAPFRTRALLRDTTGTPVPDAEVTLLVDGEARAVNATGDDGRVGFRPTLSSYGDHTLAFRFPGDANRGPSNASIDVTAARVGVDAPDALVVPRGGNATLQGRTLVAGEPGPADVVAAGPGPVRFLHVSDQPNLTLPSSTAFLLDPGPGGTWTLPLYARPAADLGPTDVVYRRSDGDGSPVLARTEVTIKAPARIAIDAPTPLPRGEPATVRLRLAAEDAPLGGEEVTATARHDGQTLTRRLQTDGTGSATLGIPADWTGAGEVRVEAAFAGTDRETRTQAARTLPVEDPLLPDLPPGWPGAALALGLAAAGAAAGRAGWLPGVAGAWHRLLGRREPRLEVRLREADPDIPPIWGLDEPCTLQVAAADPRDGDRGWAGETLEVTLEGEVREMELGADGTAAVATLQRDAPAEVPVGLRYAGDRDRGLLPAEARTPVRFVEWGPEMTRAYEALRAWGRDRGLDLPDPATPREVGAALHAAGAPREAVADLVRRFEAVNYAGQDPTRADWIRLVRARDRIQAAIEEGPHGG